MNNGSGEESSRGTESSLRNSRRNGEFAQALVRIAVAQICESLGLQGFQNSALDRLSDIACKYVQDIGKLSSFYASLAGRTESNVFDVVHGLEDLGISQGFVGGSDLDRCLSESGVVKEISRYVGESEEVGFAYSVPAFPVVKEREATPSFFLAAETPSVDNVPPWLPCFPDPKTYTSSGCSASIEQSDTKDTRKDTVDQDLKVDMSLLRACYGFKVPFVIKAGHSNGKEQVNNPFLASPLEYGKRKISLVSLPARLVEEDVAQNHSLWAKHVSSLWAFSPVIQEFKSCDLDNTYEGSKEVAVEGRPAVQLKFNTCKKSSAIANKYRKIEDAESMSWFAIDDSRNDKKTTKEKIADDSLENGSHALTHT